MENLNFLFVENGFVCHQLIMACLKFLWWKSCGEGELGFGLVYQNIIQANELFVPNKKNLFLENYLIER